MEMEVEQVAMLYIYYIQIFKECNYYYNNYATKRMKIEKIAIPKYSYSFYNKTQQK